MESKFKFSPRTKIFFGFSFIIFGVIVCLIVLWISVSSISKAQQRYAEATGALISLNDYNNAHLGLSAAINHSAIQPQLVQPNTLNDKKAALEASYKLFCEKVDIVEGFKTEVDRLNSLYAGLDSETELVTQLLRNRNPKENISLEKWNQIYDNSVSVVLVLQQALAAKAGEIRQQATKTTTVSLSVLSVLGVLIVIIAFFLIRDIIKLIKNATHEVREGINVLGSSVAEILSTVTEIATGATETSTSINETTTTLEEVRQTSLVAGQKAQTLMLSSQRASDSVEAGKESVANVIEAIQKIDEQMKVIAETVVKLSEQNQSVSDITATVADIADQSNLLAVNAAIEAAKAGEHGRGFAVVAQEIRRLSEQSKKATIQVKEILSEIQKLINQTVLVTKQGGETVATGRKLSEQSGEAIELLAQNVDETFNSSIQINSSSQQQIAGMDQIVPAMENIRQASEQNVVGMKQTREAVNDMKNLGQKLKELVDRFNL